MNGKSDSINQEKYDAPACIRDIFLHDDKYINKLNSYIKQKSDLKTEFKEKLLIYTNMVEIRATNPLQFPRNKGSEGKKGTVKEFSKKSRREFIKFLSKIDNTFHLWQDLTFADDVMNKKETRTKNSNQALNRFRRIILNKYPSIKIAYKREWQPRKSGALEGEYIPHFHMFISVTDMLGHLNCYTLAGELALIWVKCTQTTEIMKSQSVALHSKSYRLIENQKHALKYASKYISKPAENWTEESIGRSWGTIGKFNIPKPEVREVTPDEMVHIKRRFRKIAPKRHPIQKALRNKETPMFLIVNQKTVTRIIQNTESILDENCFTYFEEDRN